MIRKPILLLLPALLCACSNTERGEAPVVQQTDTVSGVRDDVRDSVAATPPPAPSDDTGGMAGIRADARKCGIDFRAVGQEPGWLVEIDDGKQMSVLADYGEKKFTVPAPAPEKDAGSGITTYRSNTAEHKVTLTVQSKPCNDAMSGLPFEATVTMVLDGTTYQGCGEWISKGVTR